MRIRRCSRAMGIAGLACGIAGLIGLPGSGAAHAAPPSIAASSAVSGISTVAGRLVTVTGTDFDPDAAVVVAQCSAAALRAAQRSVNSALDDCEQRSVAVARASASGTIRARVRELPEIQTAGGAVDCRRSRCLLGALNLEVLQGTPLQVAVLPLHFSSQAVAAPARRPHPAPRSPAGFAARPRRPQPIDVTPRQRLSEMLVAYPAGRLGSGRTGVRVHVPARPLPRRPVRGEGLLALTLKAPGTSWASRRHTSVVVQARVDAHPWQTIVLFAGARPFTYEGFTGDLTSGRHRLQVRIQPHRSVVADRPPRAVVVDAELRVADPRTRFGAALAHAPIVNDRAAGTSQGTPLETYATSQPLGGGARRLSYTIVFSRETAGTGFVPWLEWGTWGRMTDIETAITFDLSARGAISHAHFLGCSACGPHFPSGRTALNEVQLPFKGRIEQGHPVLRVSTGNNDFSDSGRTPLRFAQALGAPPPAGDTREGAMDRNPWTYQVMGQELRRARLDYDTSATSFGPGDPRQYVIVQLRTAVHDVASVEVTLRLAGSHTTYTNDLGTTYPLYDGGDGRTVVKLPRGLAGHRVTAVGLRLLPSSAGASPSIKVRSLRILRFTGSKVIRERAPRPHVGVRPLPPAATGTPTLTAGP